MFGCIFYPSVFFKLYIGRFPYVILGWVPSQFFLIDVLL